MTFLHLSFILGCPVLISVVRQKPGWARWPGKIPESGLYWWLMQPLSAQCHPWLCALLELPVAFCAPNSGLSTIMDIVVGFRGAMFNHMDCCLWGHVGPALLIYPVFSFFGCLWCVGVSYWFVGKIILLGCLSCKLLGGCCIPFTWFSCGTISSGMLFFHAECSFRAVLFCLAGNGCYFVYCMWFMVFDLLL